MTAATASPAFGRAIAGVPTRSWADLGVLSVLSVIGVLGFETSFGGLGFLLAAFGGLVIGTAVGVFSRVVRLGIVTTALAAIVAYFLFGTALAVPSQALFAVLPTLQSLASLATGAVFGWADILTLQTPIGAPAYIAAVPYLCGWLVGLVSAVLAVRWLSTRRRTAWRFAALLLGPLSLYVIGILTGTDQPFLAGARGVVFAAIALVWVGWRHVTVRQINASAARHLLRGKIGGIAIVVVIAVVVGGGVGALVAPSTFHRFVLRDEITPPFDPLTFASPLAGFRAYKTGALKSAKLFTVTGLEKGDTIRLATMDAYSGKLWNVVSTQADADGSGSFALVGRDLPAPALATAAGTRTITVSVGAYSDVWLPSVGYPTQIQLDGKTAARKDDVRYNAVTGTAVLATPTGDTTAGLADGDRYTLKTELQKVPKSASLTDAAPAAGITTPVEGQLNSVAAKATVLAGTAKTAYLKLKKIESAMQAGYLSDGAPGAPSLAGHGADRMLTFVKQASLVGDAEQYSSAFALMAHSEGFPARVVIGFAPTMAAGQKSVTVTGSEVTAWPEVAIAGLGWIPFDPTGTNTGTPPVEPPVTKSQQVQQQRQPPRATQPQNNSLSPTDVKKDKKKAGFAIPGWAYVVGGIIVIPLVLYFIPLLLIALLKRRRRARRRNAPTGDLRTAGAWEELLDRLAELGLRVPRERTRLQAARTVESQLEPTPGRASMVEFASTIDGAVFGGEQVEPGVVDAVWAAADSQLAAVADDRPRWRRRLSRFRIRSKRGLPSGVALPDVIQMQGFVKGLVNR